MTGHTVRGAVLWLLVSGFFCVTGVARAQSEAGSEEERLEEAIRLSEIGRLFYEGGEFAQAAQAFRRAWELHPDPVLGYNAARSFENTGDLQQALSFYRATLELDFEDESIRQRCRDGIVRVENILERQAEQIARQPALLSVTSIPQGASVWISDEPVGVTPLQLELEQGQHLVRLELEGYERLRETVDLQPGTTAIVRVDLIPREPEEPVILPADGPASTQEEENIEAGEAVSSEAEAEVSDLVAGTSGPSDEAPFQPVDSPPRDSPGISTSTWLVGIFGGVGAVSIILAVLAGAKANEQYDLAQTPEIMRDDAEFDKTVEDGIAARDASNFLYLLGTTAIVTAVVLYFVTHYSSDSEDDVSAAQNDRRFSLGMTPWGVEITW